MSEPKTFVLDSNQTFLNLEKLANDKAEKLFRFRKLEKYEKVCIAKLKGTIRLQHEKISNVDLTDEAYKHWLDKYTEAEKDYNLAKDKYNNFIALKDMRITEESSARYLINKKI
jgi:hypothetical protein